MENFYIYLAGRCKGLSVEEQNSWREYAKNGLEALNDCDTWYRIKAINPTDYFSYETNRHKTNRQVKKYYMSMIDKSSIVLVNLNDSALSVGTGQELQHAVDIGVPIVGFGTENMYPWETEEDCQVVFETLDEAIDYIRDYYICLK